MERAMVTTNQRKPDVSDFLSSPRAYAAAPLSVDTRETHISKVYLTKKSAYKLKKPVRYDFLDFSSPELRHAACDAELRLNRRLAPGVYKAVLPVCRDVRGSLSIDGEGLPVDWLVQMKRLDDRNSLKSRIESGVTTRSEISALSDRLAQFYAGQTPLMTKSLEFRQTLALHIDANRYDLHQRLAQHDGERDGPGYARQIDRSYAAQMRFIKLKSDVFDDRVCDGRIVDGHGDLRPEHIYFDPEPIVIDCIEFNAEFRHNDIIDELAFLGMECDFLGASAIGEQVIRAYSKLSHDVPPASLISFYKCYRACVRAKVAAIRSGQADSAETHPFETEAATYLGLADRFASELGPNLIITIGGLMGTGKTTLADEISSQLFGLALHTDNVRQEVFNPHDGNGNGGNGSRHVPRTDYGKGNYSNSSRRQVYDEMIGRLPGLIQSNPTVVLDGTFSQESTRQRVARVSEGLSAKWLHVECVCSRETAIERIRSRQAAANSPSEARPDIYDAQIAEYQAPQRGTHVVTVDTTLPFGQQIEGVLDAVEKLI